MVDWPTAAKQYALAPFFEGGHKYHNNLTKGSQDIERTKWNIPISSLNNLDLWTINHKTFGLTCEDVIPYV